MKKGDGKQLCNSSKIIQCHKLIKPQRVPLRHFRPIPQSQCKPTELVKIRIQSIMREEHPLVFFAQDLHIGLGGRNRLQVGRIGRQWRTDGGWARVECGSHYGEAGLGDR